MADQGRPYTKQLSDPQRGEVPQQRHPPDKKNGGAQEPADRPHDCSHCTIEGMTMTPAGAAGIRVDFSNMSSFGNARVPESTVDLVVTAHPDDPACPCEWDDRINMEYIRIHTGLANQSRQQLFRMPQLVQPNQALMSENPEDFRVAGCSLTIAIELINRVLRAGNMTGVQFNLKAVPLRIAGRVRCGRRWRKYLVEFTD